MERVKHKPYGPYEKYFKRPLDLLCGLLAVAVFWWLYLILIILGAIFMGGNPFFTQERPGKDEKIFKLIKFRSMDNRKDKDGNLLPDEVRLNKYGRFIRKTSLDELPEAFNIIKGDMSVIGPRPLLVKYLPYYSEEERVRHCVRPGLSGLAQVNGRNAISWEEKLNYDFSHLKSKELNLEDESVMLAIRKGNLLLTENWFWTSKFFNLFPSMNVGNWLYLSGYNKYEDYSEWMLRMNHMGVPMTAEQIVRQYEEFAKGNPNYYNSCLSNIDYNHYTYNEVFTAGDKILKGLYVPSRIQAVTNMITLVFKNLSASIAAGVYGQVKVQSVNRDFNNCVYSALQISHPELFEKGYNGILVQ